jgi:hypothetical protein
MRGAKVLAIMHVLGLSFRFILISLPCVVLKYKWCCGNSFRDMGAYASMSNKTFSKQ